ncbi:MAG: CDP-alcohol phosphatidyltransferase family protein [Candidatus Nomurabacteria bacterium]|nr:CDP-alcohol phosphatidyltransferase family protein [Candidatus Nomurabacteria bacterium]
MRKYLIADMLTVSRFAWAAVLVLLAIFGVELSMVLVIATTLALLTDALDGAAARKWPWPEGVRRFGQPAKADSPGGSKEDDFCLDTPADLALGAGMVVYTYLVVSPLWGLVLFSAVPLGLIGLLVIHQVELRQKREAKTLRGMRLAAYFAYIGLTLVVWVFHASANPWAWVVAYVVGALVLAVLKRGRLIYGKIYNRRRRS